MIFVISVAVLSVYILPLLIFYIALLKSRLFFRESMLVKLMAPVAEQSARMRDIIATIFVPLLTLFSISLDRDMKFDPEALFFALFFVSSCILSFIAYATAAANASRLADYGADFANPIIKMLENYSRETLIYVAVMIGVSAGPVVTTAAR